MYKSYLWFKNQILNLGGEVLWVILGQIFSVLIFIGGGSINDSGHVTA